MHALIIEDHSLISLMIEDELRVLGFETFDRATTEDQAVAMASRHFPNLITADDRLTSGNGIEAVRRICADQLVPVIFMAGDPGKISSVLPNAIVLEKPVTIDQLRRAVGSAAMRASVLRLFRLRGSNTFLLSGLQQYLPD